MELNAEQIIKALEWCTNADEVCEGCILFEVRDCNVHLLKNALALIKQLTEEKKDLEYTLLGVMHSVGKWLDGAELEQDEVNRAATMREKTLQIVERLTEENEGLKQTITQLGKNNDEIARVYPLAIKEAKDDTVRSMRSRIKSRCIEGGIYPAFVERVIDQIAKEMLEGINGTST